MPVSVILAATAVALSVPLLWWALASTRSPHRAVVSNLTSGQSTPADLRQMVLDRPAHERAVFPLVRVLADKVQRFTPGGWLERLERNLTIAGRPADWPLERVLAAKLLLGVGGLLAGLTVLPGGLLATIGYSVVCYFLPDVLMRSRARRRQKVIKNDLADTLDQITIAVDAGLGFETAMARAGRTGTGPLAEELVRTLQEMQIGVPRPQALRALSDRTDVDDLRHVILAILQAERYGVPIVETLRIQSKEMRVKRRQRAEERAMKVPVKVVFPLVLCILPVLFVIVLGPSGIALARILGGQ